MTTSNSETCHNPDCRYVPGCQFATVTTGTDTSNNHSLRIFPDGMALLHVTGSIDDNLEAVVVDLHGRQAEYKGLLVHVQSNGGVSGPCQNIKRMLHEIGTTVPLMAYIHHALSAACEIALTCHRVYIYPDGTAGGLGTHIFKCFQGKTPCSVISSVTTQKEFDVSGAYVYDTRSYSPQIADNLQFLCNKSLLDTLTTISAARGLPISAMEPFVDGSTFGADKLVTIGIVDAVLQMDEALKKIKDMIRKVTINKQPKETQ